MGRAKEQQGTGIGSFQLSWRVWDLRPSPGLETAGVQQGHVGAGVWTLSKPRAGQMSSRCGQRGEGLDGYVLTTDNDTVGR